MRIFLDSMVFIYAFSDSSPYFQDASLIFERIKLKHNLLSSLFIRAELLVYPTHHGDQFSVARINRLFTSSAVQITSFSESSVQTFAVLRGTHLVKPLDAVHLSTAASAEADLFITNDKKLLSLAVPGISRIVSIEDALQLI